MHRLPRLPALDAEARADRSVYGEPEKLAGIRGGHLLPLDGLAEQKLELRPVRPEIGRRREGQIDLQTTRKEEDAVEGRAIRLVEERGGSKLLLHQPREVPENLADRDVPHDPEGQVEVGPPIRCAQSG